MNPSYTRPDEGAPAVASLADRVEVIDALYRFGAGQDLRDRALFESAFGEHASVDFTGPARRFGVSIPVFVGRTAIANTILGTVSPLDTTHTVTNPRVTLDGDRAALFALVEAQHVSRADHRRRLLLKNIYRVGLSRDGARWTIDSMVIENVWFEGDPAVLFPGAGSGNVPADEQNHAAVPTR